MLEKILYFVTPGPLTENFRFNIRVLYSWITLGLVVDVIIAIIALSSGASLNPQILIAAPIGACIYGFLGLGLDFIRGRNQEYAGWYWWLLPIFTPVIIGLWLCFAIIGMSLAMAGVKLPKFSNNSGNYKRPKLQKIDPDKFREELEEMKLKDILEQFKEQIQQLQQLEQENKLEPEQKEVVRKLLSFNPSEYNQMFRDLFEEDELEELILLILMMLGVEVN